MDVGVNGTAVCSFLTDLGIEPCKIAFSCLYKVGAVIYSFV